MEGLEVIDANRSDSSQNRLSMTGMNNLPKGPGNTDALDIVSAPTVFDVQLTNYNYRILGAIRALPTKHESTCPIKRLSTKS